MATQQRRRRLFFGMDVTAPWPEELPKGRIIDVESRHMTLAFLGDIDAERLFPLLDEFPRPPFPLGESALFDECFLLPSEEHPRVAAWHLHFHNNDIIDYQQRCISWLNDKKFVVDERIFFPHVTIARHPFFAEQWLKAFVPLPAILNNVILYESIGDLTYKPLWSHRIKYPIVEIKHAGIIAFKIRGMTLQQLYLNALTALAFKDPTILPWCLYDAKCKTIDDIAIALNNMISSARNSGNSHFVSIDLCESPEKNEGAMVACDLLATTG